MFHVMRKYIELFFSNTVSPITQIQKPNSAMSVMFCTGATSVKKTSCLVAKIVSCDTVGLHLPTFRILEPYQSKDILILMALL